MSNYGEWITLALGERQVNAMYGVTGADSFMAAASDIEEREEENIVGIMRPVRVFMGDAQAPLFEQLGTTEALKSGYGFSASSFNAVNPHVMSTKGAALITVINLVGSGT